MSSSFNVLPPTSLDACGITHAVSGTYEPFTDVLRKAATYIKCVGFVWSLTPVVYLLMTADSLIQRSISPGSNRYSFPTRLHGISPFLAFTTTVFREICNMVATSSGVINCCFLSFIYFSFPGHDFFFANLVPLTFGKEKSQSSFFWKLFLSFLTPRRIGRTG